MSGAELAVILAAIVIGSVVKAVTGMGLPLIAVPIAALFVDLQDAIVVIALPNVAANLVLAIGAWNARHETRDLPVLAGFGIAGAIGGTILLVNVSETPLLVLLVVAIVGYLVLFFAHPDLRTTPDASRRWSPLVGTVAGGFQGAIGISGPIVGSWIHSYRLPRGAHILSVTALFFLTGITQFVILVGAGELSGRVAATLLACIPVLAAIPLGTWLRSRISSRVFDLAVLGLLGASAMALLIRLLTTGG